MSLLVRFEDDTPHGLEQYVMGMDTSQIWMSQIWQVASANTSALAQPCETA